jgi:hypothetical protein
VWPIKVPQPVRVGPKLPQLPAVIQAHARIMHGRRVNMLGRGECKGLKRLQCAQSVQQAMAGLSRICTGSTRPALATRQGWTATPGCSSTASASGRAGPSPGRGPSPAPASSRAALRSEGSRRSRG